MKRSHSFLVLSTLLGSGLCWVMYRSFAEAPAGDTTVPASTATPEPTELAELRQQVTQLRTQIRVQGHRLAAAAPASAGANDPAATEDPRTDPQTRAAEERKHKEYVGGVDTEFRNEAMNLKWSSATSSLIQATLDGNNDLRPLARGMECRSRTCRVEIADDGSGKLSKLLPLFVHEVGRDLPTVVFDRIQDDGGSATMVLYMSRRDESAAAP